MTALPLGDPTDRPVRVDGSQGASNKRCEPAIPSSYLANVRPSSSCVMDPLRPAATRYPLCPGSVGISVGFEAHGDADRARTKWIAGRGGSERVHHTRRRGSYIGEVTRRNCGFAPFVGCTLRPVDS